METPKDDPPPKDEPPTDGGTKDEPAKAAPPKDVPAKVDPPEGEAPKADTEGADAEEIIIGPRPAKLGPPKQVGLPLDDRPLLSPTRAKRGAAAAAPAPKPPAALAAGPAKPIKQAQSQIERASAFSKKRLVTAAVILVSLGIPTYFALTGHVVRDAGIGAFIAMSLAFFSIITSNIRLLQYKTEPRALTLAAVAAGAGVLAILIASISGIAMHSDADDVAKSDIALEYGMREYLTGEAQANGRVAALFGLIAIPGVMVGLLDLAMVLGARRIAETEARIKKTESEPVAPVWLALAGCSVGFIVGFITDLYAIFLSVERAPNPREAVVDEVRDAVTKGDMKKACEGLERVLARDYVPERVLEEKLPGRVELAHRCITRDIDDLPAGHLCEASADKLLDKEIVRVAGAKDRIKKACKAR